MDASFDIEPEVFHERKRRRIIAMNDQEPPAPTQAPTSLPGVHEIATFLPGRLEFEHEVDNEAEDLVKDLEFGIVLDYGGDQIIEDENDLDVRARAKWEEEKRSGVVSISLPPPIPTNAGKGPPPNGILNGYHINGDVKKLKPEDSTMSSVNGDDEGPEEPTQPLPFETKDSLAFKLTLMEMYFQRVDKRLETKGVIFERGLLDYKKVSSANRIGTIVKCWFSRCKLPKRSVPEKNVNSCIVCDPSQDYKLLKIMKLLRLICYVRIFQPKLLPFVDPVAQTKLFFVNEYRSSNNIVVLAYRHQQILRNMKRILLNESVLSRFI